MVSTALPGGQQTTSAVLFRGPLWPSTHTRTTLQQVLSTPSQLACTNYALYKCQDTGNTAVHAKQVGVVQPHRHAPTLQAL